MTNGPDIEFGDYEIDQESAINQDQAAVRAFIMGDESPGPTRASASKDQQTNLDEDPLIRSILAEAERAKCKKPPPIKEYAAARDTILQFGRPVAAISGELFALTPASGWTHVTQTIRSRLDEKMGRSAAGAMAIVLNRLSIPDISYCDHQTVYYEAHGQDRWGVTWTPADISPSEVVFSDGIYDAVHDTLRPLSSTLWGPRLTIPYHYNTDLLPDSSVDAERARFDATIRRAFPDPEVARHFQEVMATILQPHYHVRYQIVFWGVPHSGKSTLAQAIAVAPAGITGVSWAQESQLVRDKWSTILLHNRFANVSDDSARTKAWTSFLKSYTSGHLLIEGKGHKPLCVTPSAKLISTCNEMQDLQDPSGAAAQRIIAFRFDHPIPRVHSVDQDEPLKPSYWVQPARRQAIIGWMLEGLNRLHTRGGFLLPKSWLEQNQDAISESDPLLALLHDRVEAAPPDKFLSTAALRQIVDVTPQALSYYIGRLFPNAKRTKARVNGERLNGYQGLKLAE